MSARTGSSGCRRYCTPTRPMWVCLHCDTASRRPHAGESACLRQQAQALPSTPGRRAFSTARLVGWGRRRWAGHIPPPPPPHWHPPQPLQAGRCNVSRPAGGGPAGPRPRTKRLSGPSEQAAGNSPCPAKMAQNGQPFEAPESAVALRAQKRETFYSPSRPRGRPSCLCPHHKGAAPPLPARGGSGLRS